MTWWSVWAVAVVLAGLPGVHGVVTVQGTIWEHIDVWAPAVNSLVLVWLAKVQISASKNAKEVKKIAQESHNELVEAVKEVHGNGKDQ